MRAQEKIITIYLIFIIVGAFTLLYIHEQVHVEIYRGYGIESHIEYFSHLPKYIVAIPDEPCDIEACILAHNINEIVGYPIQLIYGVIAIGFLVLFILIDLDGDPK